jgi:hypothetical protein
MWELEKKVLAFFHIPPPHTGVNLTEKLLSLLREWGVEKNIFKITVILDLRFKLQFVEYCYGKLFGCDGDKLANDIIDKLKAFFPEYHMSSKEISDSSS